VKCPVVPEYRWEAGPTRTTQLGMSWPSVVGVGGGVVLGAGAPRAGNAGTRKDAVGRRGGGVARVAPKARSARAAPEWQKAGRAEEPKRALWWIAALRDATEQARRYACAPGVGGRQAGGRQVVAWGRSRWRPRNDEREGGSCHHGAWRRHNYQPTVRPRLSAPHVLCASA